MKTRAIAIEILARIEEQGAFLSEELRRAEKERGVNLPLLQKLVKGVLSRRSQLDGVLKKALRNFPGEYEVKVGWLYRLAAYQLLFFERVSRSLVFRETKALGVKLKARGLKAGIEALDGLKVDSLTASSGDGAKLSDHARTAAEQNHPEWVIKAWNEEFGKSETIKLCEANNRPWPVVVRANTLRTTPEKLLKHLREEGVRCERTRWSESCIVIQRIKGEKRLTDLKSFRQGFLQVQDESAALVTELLDPQPGESVIDMCAAPGGKATHCAERMGNKGYVLAVDLNEDRLKKIVENCRRLKLSIVKFKAADATTLSTTRKVDKVLLDAPCSGLGVLGRKTDVRWLRRPEQVKELVSLQDQLLAQATKLLKPGGILVYSTCTLLRRENEERVEKALASGVFTLAETPAQFPANLINKEGYLKLLPHRHGTGGAFAARLKFVGS